MGWLRGIFFAIVQVIELPVNLLLELWQLPGRGRGLLFGLPSLFVFLLTLLAIGWAKYGSNQDMISDYWRSHRVNKEQLANLNQLIGEKDLTPSALGPTDDPPEQEKTPAPKKTPQEETEDELVDLIQREIKLPRDQDIIGNPQVVVRLTVGEQRKIERVELVTSSGVPDWDQAVIHAVEKTDALRRVRSDESVPSNLQLEFGFLETEREKLLYTMIIGLKKLIDLDPSKPQFKYEYAILSDEMGNHVQARLMMEQVASADKPGLCEGHIWQARQIWTDKTSMEPVPSRQQRCMNHLRLALASDPSNLEANEGLGELYFSLGNYAEAEKHYLIVWEEQLSTTLRLIAIYNAQNDLVKLNEILSKSKIRLEELLEMDPKNIVYVIDIERIYLLQDKKQEAIDFLLSHVTAENQAKIHGRVARIYAGWAKSNALLNKGIFSAADFELTKKALEYDPNLADAKFILTVMGTQASDFADDALALYDPVADRASAPAEVLREYAGYLISKNRHADAIAWLEEAYQRFADDPITANNLAYLLISAAPPDPERAHTIISKAIEKLPDGSTAELRASLYDTKAAALSALQRYVEAIPYLEGSLQYRVDHEPTIAALRECYLATGQKEIADFYQRRLDALKAAAANK